MSRLKNNRNGAVISVIVPVYNGEKYIRRCLDSILKQTYPWIEVIVIDDGSFDGTASVVRKASAWDKRIRYFYQENRGVSSARNMGLRKAKGEYISFIDADDTIAPEMFSVLTDDMNSTGSDLAYCNFSCMDWESGKTMHLLNISGCAAKCIAGTRLTLECIINKNGFACNKIVKTDLIRNTYFDEEIGMCEDLLFWVECLRGKSDIKIYYENKYLYHYYMRKTSVSLGMVSDRSMTFIQAFRKMEQLCLHDKMLRELIIYYFVSNMMSYIHRIYKEPGGFHSRKQKEYIQILKKELLACNRKYELASKQKFYCTLLHIHPRLPNLLYTIKLGTAEWYIQATRKER